MKQQDMAKYQWVLNAKTPEARAKCIVEIVAKAERNERANQYIRKS